MTEHEIKGLKMRIGKSKVLKCKVASDRVGNSAKWLCDVCSKGDGKLNTVSLM